MTSGYTPPSRGNVDPIMFIDPNMTDREVDITAIAYPEVVVQSEVGRANVTAGLANSATEMYLSRFSAIGRQAGMYLGDDQFFLRFVDSQDAGASTVVITADDNTVSSTLHGGPDTLAAVSYITKGGGQHILQAYDDGVTFGVLHRLLFDATLIDLLVDGLSASVHLGEGTEPDVSGYAGDGASLFVRNVAGTRQLCVKWAVNDGVDVLASS